jgi:hypothetical protein
MTINWKPVSKPALIGGSLAAAAFMIYAAFQKSGFLLLDYVNLPIHEAGHLVFGPFGPTLGVWGGTLLQLLFPLLFAVYFALRGETAGTAFSAFWFGESLLYSSVYIGDAQAMILPLVGGGEHDWNIILSDLGALRSARTIADIVRFLAWTAMLLSVLWFVKRGRESLGEIPSDPGRP